MMHHEFEQIAGYEVSYEDYTNIIEPMYMATNLSKQDFVKTINRKAFEKKAEPVEIIKYMRVRNRLGEMMTPNGCWYYVEPVNLVDVDIKTGKIIVAPLTDKQQLESYMECTSGSKLYLKQLANGFMDVLEMWAARAARKEA